MHCRRSFLPHPAGLLVPLCLLAFVTAPALADTWVVRPDGTGDAPTIQAAIDSANSGDVVELEDGVYVGDQNRDLVVYDESILVRSASGDPTSCIIECEGGASSAHWGISFSGGG